MKRIAGCVFSTSFACASPEGPPRVLVNAATFTGSRFGDEHEVAFKGIPYAEPPLGELRFRPPRSLEPVKGEKMATEFSSICPQPVGEFLCSDQGANISGQALAIDGHTECLTQI